MTKDEMQKSLQFWRQAAGLAKSRADELEAERDALAAHVERLTKAPVSHRRSGMSDFDELNCAVCDAHLGWIVYSGPHGPVYCDTCKTEDEQDGDLCAD